MIILGSHFSGPESQQFVCVGNFISVTYNIAKPLLLPANLVNQWWGILLLKLELFWWIFTLFNPAKKDTEKKLLLYS